MTNNVYDQKPKNEDIAPERDSGLTLFLISIIGLNIVIALALGVQAAQLGYYSALDQAGYPMMLGGVYDPKAHLLVGVVFAFQSVVVACAVAVWNWQKWGYYGLMVAFVIQAVLMLAAGSVPGVGGAIMGLIILVLLVRSRSIVFEDSSYELSVRERGGFLTLMLGFIIALSTAGLIALFGLVVARFGFGPLARWVSGRSDPINLILLPLGAKFGAEFVFTCAELLCAVALWRWKKWGYYGLMAVYGIGIVRALLSGNIIGVIGSMVAAFIILSVIQDRIEMFE